MKLRAAVLQLGAWSCLLVGSFVCGCGSTTQEPGALDGGGTGTRDVKGPPSGGVGTIALTGLNGRVSLRLYFAAYRDCDPLPREEGCQLRYASSCWPRIYSPPIRLTNAGAVTVSDGKTAVTYTPNADGFYGAGAADGGQLDPLLPLRVVAQGDGVPRFEAEITLPRERLTLTAPSEGAEVGRSAPLAVSWSGTTDGERAQITFQGGGDDPRTIACSPMASDSAFEIPAKFVSALEPGGPIVIGVAPANLRRLTVGDWSIDVLAYGLGNGHSVTLVP
jgi:hypothetical protein